jgi:hypothetical protein
MAPHPIEWVRRAPERRPVVVLVVLVVVVAVVVLVAVVVVARSPWHFAQCNDAPLRSVGGTFGARTPDHVLP